MDDLIQSLQDAGRAGTVYVAVQSRLCREAAAELARLTDEVGRLRADGARYRWLRDKANELEIMVALLNQRQWFHIDAMIDAAIKEAGNGS